MTPETLAALCLALPGAYEDEPFGPGTLVYRVRSVPDKAGKIFALLNGGSDAGGATRFNLKCEPEAALSLRATHPEVVPGYHMDKKHWNTVRFGGDAPVTLELNRLRELIEDSYDLVVASLPRAHQERLKWIGLGRGDADSDDSDGGRNDGAAGHPGGDYSDDPGNARNPDDTAR